MWHVTLDSSGWIILDFAKHLSSSLKISTEAYVGLYVKSLHSPHANESLRNVTVFLKF